MPEEVRVDPAVLDRAAERCHLLGADTAALSKLVEAPSVEAARGLRGWLCARAVEDVVYAWGDHFKKYAGFQDKLADAFASCARDYRASDHAAASAFDIRDV